MEKCCGEYMDIIHNHSMCNVGGAIHPWEPSPSETKCNVVGCMIFKCGTCGKEIDPDEG